MTAGRPDPVSDDSRFLPREAVTQIGLLLATVLAGTVGTYWHFSSLQAADSATPIQLLAESVFTSLGFLVLNGPSYRLSELAGPAFALVATGRIAGVVFFSYAAFLGFKTLFEEQLKPWQISRWDSDWFGNSQRHVIVCGVGQKGFKIASELLDQGHNVVVIEASEDNVWAQELSDRGAVVLSKDATQQRVLGQTAKAHRAAEVFVNCGSDRTNAEVVRTLSNWLETQSETDIEGQNSIQCNVHIGSHHWRRFIRDQLGEQSSLRLQMYDTANATARELLRRRPVDRFGESPGAGRTHIALFGWSDFGRSLVFQLCQTMHYLDGQDRQITVVCRDPAAARSELYDHYPALDPDHWDRDAVRAYADDVFPDISFVELPLNMDVLLSDRFRFYEQLRRDDTLTIVVADADEFPSGGPVSTMLPRLEELDRELGLDTSIHYFADTAEGDRGRSGDGFGIESDVVDVQPFREFVDECRPETVRGKHRDDIAKRIALFFHLRYDYNVATEQPTQLDRDLAAHIPFDPPQGSGYEYERTVELWDQLSRDERDLMADLVWRRLSEPMRDANRHAADHARIKRRIAAALSDREDRETIVRNLGEVEHQRWCAEKFLNGWEPLPEAEAPRWRADADAQQVLRRQKFHLDIRPLSELDRLTEDEFEKDVSLVRFVLNHLRVDTPTVEWTASREHAELKD